MSFEALSALAAGERARAADLARNAASADHDDRLAAALADYLGSLPGAGVYEEPSAFEAFIDHGDNPELYRRTIAEVARVHAEARPVTVVDVGCGDGRVTAAVVGAATRRVDLVEPAGELLDRAVDRLRGSAAEVVPHQAEVAAHLEGLGPEVGWDLVQSTFALHTVRPEHRAAVIGSLRERARRVAVVEFDVPAFADRSAEHVGYLAQRYEAGVRVYAGHPEVVRGFLLPVLVGQLDPGRPRYTFERPIARWVDQFADAGFRVSTVPVFDHWWAPAVLISAVGDGP